ncbi:MAG TPA: hypothetical protein VKY90_05775 [Candidatus Dormibacteraeota bacterium]|nr:hypothetical protein [Candidatus Dormibacteraeota bacterium]
MRRLDLVQTNALPGRDREFNDWYTNRHIYDILAVPGIVSAQRFRLSSARRSSNYSSMPPPFEYLALYDIDGDPDAVLQAIEEARQAGRIPWSPALDPVFSAYIYEPITQRIEKT